jgi:signal transduction histidine kinase
MLNKFLINHRVWALALLGASLLFAASAVVADEDRGTAEEAQALVTNAIAFYDSNGREAAFAAYEDKQGQFVDHDLYIFIYGPGRTIDAHGADTNLNGTPVDTLIDINGKPFGTALMDEATEEGVWVDYTWYNPVTRELHPKSSWVVRHDGYVFGAGIYLPADSADGADNAE